MKRLLLALGFSLFVGTASAQTTITVDPNTTHQTIEGWSGVAQIGQHECGDLTTHNNHVWDQEIVELAVDSLGLTKLRLELKPGVEHPDSNFVALFEAGSIDFATMLRGLYRPVNDDADPNNRVDAHFHWDGIDTLMTRLVVPMKQRLQARGEDLHLELAYVHQQATGTFATVIHDNGDEYGELILAAVEHLDNAYGIIPNSINLLNEPNIGGVSGAYSNAELLAMLNAADARLDAAGYTQIEWTLPATSNVSSFPGRVDAIMPSATANVTRFDYHRYGSGTSRISFGSASDILTRAATYGLPLVMGENTSGTLATIIYDLQDLNIVGYQQYALAFCTSDAPDASGRYITIDDASSTSNPPIFLSTNTSGGNFPHVFREVRPGAVRIDASASLGTSDVVAFENADGRQVVVIRNASAGSETYTITGLDAGEYGAYFTSATQTIRRRELDTLSIGTGENLVIEAPDNGALTVYAIEGDGGGGEEEPDDPTPGFRLLGGAAGVDTTDAGGRVGFRVASNGLTGTTSDAAWAYDTLASGQSYVVSIGEKPSGGHVAFADAGVMAAPDTSAISRMAALTYSTAGLLWPMTRTNDGGTTSVGSAIGVSLPVYLRVRLVDTSLYLERSADSLSWLPVDTVDVSGWSQVLAGRVASSYDDASATTVFLEGAGLAEGGEVSELLLDLYPDAIAAYSLYDLSSTNDSPALRIYRESDGAGTDIGFAAGLVDTAAISTFCAGTTCRVGTWYNQVDGAPDLVQTDPAKRPYVYENGAVVKNDMGTVAIRSNSGNAGLIATGFDAFSAQELDYFIVVQHSLPDSSDSALRYLMTFSPPGDWAHEAPFVRWTDGRSIYYGDGSVTVSEAFAAPQYPTTLGFSLSTDSMRVYTNQVERHRRDHTPPGETYTTLAVGMETKSQLGHAFGYLSEIVLRPSGGPEEREDVYLNVNQRWATGPSYWNEDALFAQSRQSDVTLYNYWATLDTTDFSMASLIGQEPTWDGTYASEAELERIWAEWRPEDGDAREIPAGQRLAACHYTLKEKSAAGADCGLEGTGVLRVPTIHGGSCGSSASYDCSGARASAFFVRASLPLSGGGEGNPFYQNRALAHRVMAWAMAYLVQMKDSETWAMSQVDILSAYMRDIGQSMYWILTDPEDPGQSSGFFPDSVEQAFVDAMVPYLYRISAKGMHHGLQNLGARGLPGLAAYDALLHERPELDADGSRRRLLHEAVMRSVFGSKKGSLTYYEPGAHKGLYSPEGGEMEGNGPDSDYGPRGMTDVAEACMAISHVPSALVDDTWAWCDTWLARTARFYSAQIAPDPLHGGALMAGSSYSSRVPAQVPDGQYAAWLWWKLLEYPDGEIKAADVPADNTAAASSAQSAISSVAPFAYLPNSIPTFTTKSVWTPEVPEYTPGLFQLARSIPLELRTPVPARDTTYLAVMPGTDEVNTNPAAPAHWSRPRWIAARDTLSDGTAWYLFADMMENSDGYGSHGGGQVHLFGTKATGPMILTRRHQKASDDAPTRIHGDSTLINAFYGRLDDGAVYSTSWVNQRDSTKWNPADSSGTLWGKMISRAVIGGSLAGTWTTTRTIKVTPTGYRAEISLEHAGSADFATELRYGWPFYVRHASDATATGEFSVWTGEAWVKMLSKDDSATGEWGRWCRSDSGVEAGCVWIHSLDGEVRFTVGPEISVANAVGRNVWVDLNPNGDGATVQIPDSMGFAYEVTVQDPGLVGSIASATKVYPQAGDVYPEGGILYGRFVVDPGAGGAADSVGFEVLASGGSWTAVGEAESEDGATWDFVGGTVPASLDSIRIVVVVGEDTTLHAWEASSAPTSLAIQDDFSPDGTIDASYTFDVNTPGLAVVPVKNSLSATGGVAAASTDDPWRSQVRTPVGSDNYIVKLWGKGGTETNGSAIIVRGSSYYQNIRAFYNAAQFWLEDHNNPSPPSKPISINTADFNRMELQANGAVVIASLYDTGGNLKARSWIFGTPRTSGAPGFGTAKIAHTMDAYEVTIW